VYITQTALQNYRTSVMLIGHCCHHRPSSSPLHRRQYRQCEVSVCGTFVIISHFLRWH